jgi:hypothetical protein
MTASPLPRRWRAVPLLAAVLAGGCNENSGNAPIPEPDVATMRITVAGQAVDVSSEGDVFGGPFLIGDGISDLTVVFLEPGGGPSDLVTPEEFRLDVLSGNTGVVSATRVGPLEFDLNHVSDGVTELSVALVHVDPGHTEFGPFDIAIQADAGGGGGGPIP